MSLPQVRITDVAGTTYLDFDVTHNVGSLIVEGSSDWLRQGRAMAGSYNVYIDSGSINTGVTPKTCTVKITPDHNTNPLYRTANTFTGIKLDGSTAYENMVPDTSLVFADYATGVVDTWNSDVMVGMHLGAFEDDNPGGSPPGEAVYTQRFGILNTGATLVEEVTLSVSLPPGVLWAKAGNGVFEYFIPVLTGADEKTDGGTGQLIPYKITLGTVSGGQVPLYVDTALITTIRRMSNNTTGNSSAVYLDERYRIESGGLEGYEFLIRATATASDTANVSIWQRYGGQISDDNAGVAVGFDTVDLTIGSLDPAELDHWWLEVFANVGSGLKNPVQIPVHASWLNTGVAAIEEA